MRRGRTWGDELTLRAICNFFGCHIHVVTSQEHNWYLRWVMNLPSTPPLFFSTFFCFPTSMYSNIAENVDVTQYPRYLYNLRLDTGYSSDAHVISFLQPGMHRTTCIQQNTFSSSVSPSIPNIQSHLSHFPDHAKYILFFVRYTIQNTH
jgi:hypothetical protein